MPIQLLRDTPAVRLGAAGSLFVNVWYTQASVEGLKAMDAEARLLRAKYGSVSYLSLSHAMPGMPDAEVLKFVKEEAAGFSDTLGTVVCILPRGAGAVFARSFIAAVSLFVSHQIVVVKDLGAAAKAVRDLEGQVPEVTAMTSLEQDLADFLAIPRPA